MGFNKEVIDRINKRSREIRKVKDDVNGKINLREVLAKATKEAERARETATNPVLFADVMTGIVSLLQHKLARLDRLVRVNFRWSEFTIETDWKQIYLDGIEVHWSHEHLAKNPTKPEIDYYPTEALWFEELTGEET